jgi:hypothetical protein
VSGVKIRKLVKFQLHNMTSDDMAADDVVTGAATWRSLQQSHLAQHSCRRKRKQEEGSLLSVLFVGQTFPFCI